MSQWFLVCLGVTSVTSFQNRRPMQIMVPRIEWGDFNDWVYGFGIRIRQVGATCNEFRADSSN